MNVKIWNKLEALLPKCIKKHTVSITFWSNNLAINTKLLAMQESTVHQNTKYIVWGKGEVVPVLSS
jgi:hypothetical protein